jgi:ribosomal protein S13
MSRLLGADIPSNKRAVIALRSLSGIGEYRARAICEAFNIESHVRAHEALDESTLYKIGVYIKDQGWLTGPDLKRFEADRIMSEIANQTTRGKRHQAGRRVRSGSGRRNGRTARKLARFVQNKSR